MRTQQNGFVTLGNNTGRSFGNQQGQQQHLQQDNGYSREEAPVVAWLNIYMAGTTGERKKLGKGIPLRDTSPLERALINLMFDENMEPREDFDIEQLKGAMILDARPANRPDEDFELDLFGALSIQKETTPEVKPARQIRSKKPTAE